MNAANALLYNATGDTLAASYIMGWYGNCFEVKSHNERQHTLCTHPGAERDVILSSPNKHSVHYAFVSRCIYVNASGIHAVVVSSY